MVPRFVVLVVKKRNHTKLEKSIVICVVEEDYSVDYILLFFGVRNSLWELSFLG